MKISILLITATTTGLMAGLFFAWSCSVTVGLARLSDKEYIAAMQSINRAIQNPPFFSCFFGAALLLPLSTYLYYETTTSWRFWFLLLSSIVYLAGVIGVTVFGNVPLNERLDIFPVHAASAPQMAAQRNRFESLWNRLNHIRSLASLLALVLVIMACIDPKNFW